MNKVILVGNLTRDPEYRTTPSGAAVCNFSIAVQRRFANQQGVREADFINCVAWGKNGELCQRYLHKGMKIALEGRIQTRTYDDKDGKKVYVTEIIVEHHEFCESKKQSDSGSYAEPAQGFTEIDEDDSDLPF